MIRFLATLTKIALASLLVGVVLDKFDISANEILLKAGLTQENVVEYAQMALAWARRLGGKRWLMAPKQGTAHQVAVKAKAR